MASPQPQTVSQSLPRLAANLPPARKTETPPALTPNNAAAGAKRKRTTEKKWYAVKDGKTPGVYETWNECLDQVRGHRGAVFKAFQSQADAKAFVQGTLSAEAAAKPLGEQKYYAVQSGKTPGVYTDWPTAQAQIRGFRGPKHRKFNTRAEAEAFVAAGKKGLGLDITQLLSPEEEIRRLIVRNSAPGLVTNGTYPPRDIEGTQYELGTGPLPLGAEDNYDPNIKLAEDGTVVEKTPEEKSKMKHMIKDKEPPGMLRIYTDGSSLKNGQAGARAGIGVFFGPQDPKNVSEALKGSKQTNQRAELTAIQRALDIAPRHRDVTIYTDSKYSIDCVTNWYKNWVRNGWMNSKGKNVENKEVIQQIRSQIEERDLLRKGTYFVWVKGHANNEGNIAADQLANAGALMGRGLEEEADESVDDDEDMDSGSEKESESRSAYGNGGFSALEGHEEDVKQSVELMQQAMAEDDWNDGVR